MGWLGFIILLTVIGIIIIAIRKSFYVLNLPFWIAKTAIVVIGFFAAHYLRVFEMPCYDTMDYWDWFMIALLGGTFSIIGIAIFNSEEENGKFGDQKKGR